MKKFNQVSQKLSAAVAGAFAASAFMLSACGGGSGGGSDYSKTETRAKTQVEKRYPNAKIFSFSESKKEFGIKDECLTEKRTENSTINLHFIKTTDGEILVFEVKYDKKMEKEGFGGLSLGGTYTIDEFKQRNPNCF